jgi:hypothetical protein
LKTIDTIQELVKYFIIALLLAIFFFLIQTPLSGAEINKVMYIHSAKAPVYTQPNIQSEKIMELKTGMEIMILEEKGFWYQMTYQEIPGWIFKLMVRDTPPKETRKIDVTQLAELESKARKRPSAYTTTASARGLKTKRDRFASQYKNDYNALEKMESMVISREEADKFITDGMKNENTP